MCGISLFCVPLKAVTARWQCCSLGSAVWLLDFTATGQTEALFIDVDTFVLHENISQTEKMNLAVVSV